MTPNNSQPTFTGTETGFVDDLGRVILPQVWRDALADREICIILLSDGKEDHRLVIYPCPMGKPGIFLPEWNHTWGDLPPRGESTRRVDPKGRFCLPAIREHWKGKLLLLKGCQNHIVASPHERMKEGVDTIKGVREYLWPETDILFVQERLPCEGTATPLFRPSARKMWQTFYEVGLVTRLFKDPLAAEATVFGSGLSVADNRRLSIMTLSWLSGTKLKDGRRIVFADWERINTVCAALKARKVAFLGKKLADEGGRDWKHGGARPSNFFGYLRDHRAGDHPVRLHGLPLTKIGPESVRYFLELNT